MNLPIIIILGGLGTRLGEIAKNTPKSLIPVNGEPFISWQLKHLREQGFRRVVLCAGHMGEHIQAFVGDGSKFGLKISYSYDGKILLGTGGAVKKALRIFDDEAFFITYGDSYLPINMGQVELFYFNREMKASVMTVFKNNNLLDKSNVRFVSGEIKLYDKENSTPSMKYIDYGLSIIKKSDFIYFNDKIKFDLSELFRVLSKQKKLAGLEVFTRFYEIGSLKGLEETESFLTRKMTADSTI